MIHYHQENKDRNNSRHFVKKNEMNFFFTNWAKYQSVKKNEMNFFFTNWAKYQSKKIIQNITFAIKKPQKT